MSSTADWRKLADAWACAGPDETGKEQSVTQVIAIALRAACTRLDEQANLLGIANARAEAAETRVAEPEAELNKWHRRGYDRNAEIAKLEARLKVAVEALDTYAQFARNGELTFVSGALAQRALAKLRGEP